jgi:hypothetical protein
MLKLVQTFWPTASQLKLLILTFAAYVVSIVVFGVAYYKLYNKRETRFFIQADIAKFQADAVIGEGKTRIEQIGMEVEALQELQSAISKGNELSLTLPSGRRAEMIFSTGYLPDGNMDETMCLLVTDAEGSEICALRRSSEDLSPEYLMGWLEEEIALRRAAREERLAYVSRVSADPQTSLQFIDFMYFSGVTQTTVGYGDILPNSSGIRALVLCQILWGYALLIVVLNLVIMG